MQPTSTVTLHCTGQVCQLFNLFVSLSPVFLPSPIYLQHIIMHIARVFVSKKYTLIVVRLIHSSIWGTGMHGNLEMATALVKAGADVNKATTYGHTALSRAKEKGFAPLRKFLTKKGATK
jgi:hypothetical protein